MITNEMIEQNKATFIGLLKTITREDANISGLIRKLESSDFFVAPATTKYHGSYVGGLCEHSLKVFYNLKEMASSKPNVLLNDESLIIVGLLHDFYKMNFYKPDVRNKKVYSNNGSKYDELGRFDWVSEKAYSVIPAEERFIYGSGGETSEYMTRCYIPLTLEESIAIVHSSAGMDKRTNSDDIVSSVYDKHPLACLLHLADMMAAYVDRV